MLDSFRAEFPSLSRAARWRRIRVARETPLWALLSGVGTAFVVGGIAQIAALALAPYLLPPTEPHPEWLNPAAISEAAAGIAAGAVLMRAGSIYALLLYAAFELFRILAGIPGRLLFCERSGQFAPAGAPPLPGVACDVPSMLTGAWPTFAAFAIGALLAPALLASSGDGSNRMLRAAGAFGVLSTAFGIAVGLTPQWSSLDQQFTLTNLVTIAQVLAGIVAGVLLARSSSAATLLIVLVLIGPPLSFALPAALQPASGAEPPEFTTIRWAGLYIPVLAAAAIVAARGYVRRHGGGTFF